MPLAMRRSSVLYPLLAILALNGAAAATTPERIWPGPAPGEKSALPAETTRVESSDKPVPGSSAVIVSNVSDPTITFYRPAPAKDTGAAVLVCPGGGYHILVTDVEGTEVCAWLNSIGVTAVLLKYRVPRREGLAPHVAPLQDAQRALGIVRYRTMALGIDPHRIGVIGFSAGGNLAAMLSNNHAQRTYLAVDAMDEAFCRPDFCLLIYPAYLTPTEHGDKLVPALTISASNTPPTFIAMSEDDGVGVEGALAYFRALTDAKVPAEMHLYPKGGHGYGLRRSPAMVTTWPDRATDWLLASGWLNHQ